MAQIRAVPERTPMGNRSRRIQCSRRSVGIPQSRCRSKPRLSVGRRRPWNVPCDFAFPCAAQNEISLADAKALIRNGGKAVSEGADMPADLAGAHAFLEAKLLCGPSKAANAGGVAVSGLEQSQNSLRLSWSHEEVDTRLKAIMLTSTSSVFGTVRPTDS